MFERFTKAAREVVSNAVDLAGDRGDPRIGTEHLLAGVAATSSLAADVLDRMGAGSEQVRIAISDLDRFALAAVGIDQDRSAWERPATNGFDGGDTSLSTAPPRRCLQVHCTRP